LVQCIDARVLIATSHGPLEAEAFRDLLLSGFAGPDEPRNTSADRISNSVDASQLTGDHIIAPLGLGGDGERSAADRIDEYLDERGAHRADGSRLRLYASDALDLTGDRSSRPAARDDQ